MYNKTHEKVQQQLRQNVRHLISCHTTVSSMHAAIILIIH